MTGTALRGLFLLALLALLAGCGTRPVREAPIYPLPQPELTPPPPAEPGAIYRSGRAPGLFNDRKARGVGDIVTIRLVEQTNASKQAGTSVSKSQGINLPAPNMMGRPATHHGNPLAFDVTAERDFSGDGQSDQSNQLSGDLSATVTEVLPNGVLVIEGRKKITLNQGDEYLVISGWVRPDDITANNTVLSSQVANASIAYTGSGALADANRMGWLARFFNSAWWPF